MIFNHQNIGSLLLKNRVIRSATFEGMADENGFASEKYVQFYSDLSKEKIGAIICGFSYISPEGKAMQPGQIGVDNEDKIPLLQKLTNEVHQNNGIIFMQIAHAGRQTLEKVIGQKTLSSSAEKSLYFNQKPKELTVNQIEEIVDKFGNAALICKKAGFDGIQIHAAHGYLIHQFITPAVNKRKDKYGIDKKTKIGTRFLEEIVQDVRKKCGDDYPVLLKLSGSDDLLPKFTLNQYINLIRFVDTLSVDAIEISYGTMDFALNIFRGDIPVNTILKHNPIFKTDNGFKKILWKSFVLPFFRYKTKKFSALYNLPFAHIAKENTAKPIICVGGFRRGTEIETALNEGIDFVSLCRPFICEPDFIKKIEANISYESKCTNCNICAIMCDTNLATRCYTKH